MRKLFSTLFCVILFQLPGVSQEKAVQPVIEQTLSIIKPDAVKANQIGSIIQMIEQAGLKIVAVKMVELSRSQAAQFYSVHQERPFYKDLVTYMSSGPVVVQVLEGPDAVQAYRNLMGATDPAQAEPNTIRSRYGENIDKNAVHGSDSVKNAKTEIRFFFKPTEIYSIR
jgi:nucleoside-diphosphate kinase